MTTHFERICINCMKEKSDQNAVCPFCGYDPASYHPIPTHLPPFTILNGKYLLGVAVGQGGFGIVYIAKDLVLDITVAVKELFPSNLVTRTISDVTSSSIVSCTADPENLAAVRNKFIKEARTIAHLQERYGAGGIVQVKDLFEENNTAYLVMEYLQGKTLKEYLSQYKNIECTRLLRMLRPIMQSLHTIHEAGIIHRDISPDNIMLLKTSDLQQLDNTPVLKLLDFGNVKDTAGDSSKSIIMAVKRGYSPIEQYSSEAGQIGAWTDVYAMCATIYRCLTGKVPPEPTTLAGRSITPPSQMGVSLPSSVEKTLMKGLALNYQDRIQSMDDLITGLYTSSPSVPSSTRKSTEAPTPKGIRPLLVGGAVSAVALIALACYFILGKNNLHKKQTETEAPSKIQTMATEQTEASHIFLNEQHSSESNTETHLLYNIVSESENESESSHPVSAASTSPEKPTKSSEIQNDTETETLAVTETESAATAKSQTETESRKETEPESKSDGTKEEGTSQAESDQDAADEVIQLIHLLPDNITFENEDELHRLQKQFENLTHEQKALVPSTVYSKLLDAEAQLRYLESAQSEAEANQAAANTVIAAIDKLPDDIITLDAEKIIQSAREEYDSLTETQKELISSTSYSRLLNAEAQIQTLKDTKLQEEQSAQEVVSLIDSLPDSLTTDNEGVVSSARSAYETLSENAKTLVTNLPKLEEAEATLALQKQQQSTTETWKSHYAQKFLDTRTQYPIAPSANPFDGEVKGLCYSALAGDNGTGIPYLILCWRGDNEIAFDTPDSGRCYGYFYEICSWDGAQVTVYASNGTHASDSVNKYWLSSIDGIDYWVTWNYINGKYIMIPLKSPGTRKEFYQDNVTGQYYVNGATVDEDTYLQMCSIAEASNNDKQVSLTWTTGFFDADKETQFIPTSLDETYQELTGNDLSHIISDTNSWSTLYRKYLKKLGLHKSDTALISLVYLNDDNIPEMLIQQTSGDLYYIIVTSDGITIHIAMAPYANLKAIERSNQFMFWGQPNDYYGFAYVLSIQEGSFCWSDHGAFCRKELVESKTNYMWNNQSLNSMEEYNNKVSQQIPGGIDVVPYQTYDEIVNQLKAMK